MFYGIFVIARIIEKRFRKTR